MGETASIATTWGKSTMRTNVLSLFRSLSLPESRYVVPFTYTIRSSIWYLPRYLPRCLPRYLPRYLRRKRRAQANEFVLSITTGHFQTGRVRNVWRENRNGRTNDQSLTDRERTNERSKQRYVATTVTGVVVSLRTVRLASILGTRGNWSYLAFDNVLGRANVRCSFQRANFSSRRHVLSDHVLSPSSFLRSSLLYHRPTRQRRSSVEKDSYAFVARNGSRRYFFSSDRTAWRSIDPGTRATRKRF